MNAQTVPARGSHSSPDGSTSIEWAIPEYSAAERLLCAGGAHQASRKTVVRGWVSYFTSVEHLYCACGRRRWVKYDRSIVSTETVEPESHLDWIKGHIEMEAKFAEHRAWEERMKAGHPCWDPQRNCVSCGCSAEAPCVSHRGGFR